MLLEELSSGYVRQDLGSAAAQGVVDLVTNNLIFFMVSYAGTFWANLSAVLAQKARFGLVFQLVPEFKI